MSMLDKPIRTNYLKQKHPKSIQEQLDFMSNVIDKFVDYGGILIDGFDEKGFHLGKDYPVYTIFTQFLDVLDSISILTKKGSTTTVNILSRTLLELSVNLRYCLVMPKEKGQAAYSVCHILGNDNQKKIYDERTKVGRSFKINLEKLNKNAMRYGKIMRPPTVMINDDDEYFKKYPHIKIAKDEYDRVRKIINKDNPFDNLEPNWYSLFNGPKSFRKLLEKFDLGAYYELLYGPQSDGLHGSDALTMMQGNGEGIGITMLRNPENLQSAIFWVLDITHRLYDFIVDGYLPENRKKEYHTWFDEKVKKKYKKIKFQPLYVVMHYHKKD
jgi:hypothetical protein